MTLGEQIKIRREEKRLTQEELAEQLEVSRQSVSKWEADKAKPTKEKRVRLEEILQTSFQEEPEIMIRSKRHQNAGWICAAILAVLLGILILVMFVLMQKTAKTQVEVWEEVPLDIGEEQLVEEEKQPEFIESIKLDKTHLYDQGVQAQGDYDPTLVTAEDIEKGTLFSVTYPNSNCEMRVVRNNQVRITGDSTDGYKIIVNGEFGYTSYYFALGQEGVPIMSRMGMGISEDMDIDLDGEKEMIFQDPWNQFTIFDKEGTEYYSYTHTFAENQQFTYDKDRESWKLYEDKNMLRGEFNLLSEEELVYIDKKVKGIATYSSQYVDVGETVLTYIIDDALSDGLDPDEAVIPTPNGMISHREQAYLALEELYLLTGLKVERCFVTANEHGVYFSTVGDNFNERSFYTACLPEEYGGTFPSLYISYKEVVDYSLLAISNIYLPEDFASMTKEEAAIWFYNRLSFMHSKDITETSLTYQDSTVQLTMEDGSFYEATLIETEYGFIMDSIYGPYEKGLSH